MRILVSGGLGQVGSRVVELLCSRDDSILVIDNLATGRREHLQEHANIEVVIDTIADAELVRRLYADFRPEAVVHAAASYKDPSDWHSDALTNCVGGANVVQAAMESGVGRFIYFQTALCYGLKPLQHPIRLDHPRQPANSSYAITKTVTEEFLEISTLDYVTFRLANVVGPRNVSGPLPIFYQRLRDGKKCFVTNARRDFVFVDDLARAVVQACDGVGSGTYHFSSGSDVAILDLYTEVALALGMSVPPAPEIRELGPDDAPSILLDPSRTLADFGAIEFTPLKHTVAAAVGYYQQHGTLGEYTHLRQPATKE